MKKLLVLNTDPKDFSYGGVCPFMRNMHSFLSEAFDVEYITLPDSWRKIPGSTRVKYLIYLWINRTRLKECDFILSHGPEGSYIASFSGKPYSHIYHGNSNPMSISRYRIGKYFSKLYDKMYKRIDDTCPLVYSVGPLRNDRQKKLYNPLKQDVKPVAYDRRKGFIFAGRLESMKNVDRLITIYSKLPESVRENNPFYIAGYGTQKAALKRQVQEMRLTDQIIFLGKVDNTQMLKTDSDKRILIMASSTEGMPTAIAEAFSVGVPVISTSVGDIPSVVKDGENGFLLQLNFKDEDYIDAINKVLCDYDRFAESAYKSSYIFNDEKITKGVIDDINTLLNS